jgi:DNA polymerase III subunit alpha
MLAKGGTTGVFQFESSLATDKLRAMRCDRFEDLVATNALIRPGPLDSGMTDVYIRRKLGKDPVRYPHPDCWRSVLASTYGVITYQEQVMRMAQVLAGFTLAEADVLRKAVGKKDMELIQKEVGSSSARRRERRRARIAERDRRAGRHVRPLRLQPLPLRRLRAAQLPDGVAEAALSGGVHGRAAVVGRRPTDDVVGYIAECRELGRYVPDRPTGSRCCRPTSTSPAGSSRRSPATRSASASARCAAWVRARSARSSRTAPPTGRSARCSTWRTVWTCAWPASARSRR